MFFFLSPVKRGSLATTDVQQTLTRRMTDLRSELRDLEQKETFLDLQKFWIEQSIRNTAEDCSKYPFFSPIMPRELLSLYNCLAVDSADRPLISVSHVASSCLDKKSIKHPPPS